MSLNPRFYVSQSEILCLSIRDFISLNPRFYVSQSEILCLSIRDFISLLNNLVPNVASILSKYYKPFSHSTLYTFEKERRKKKKNVRTLYIVPSRRNYILNTKNCFARRSLLAAGSTHHPFLRFQRSIENISGNPSRFP
jgi:hypothetical protein